MSTGNERNANGPLSLKRNMAFNTVGNLVFQGCLWLITVLVVTLSHGYEDSGILSFAMTVGNMFVPIATYNLRSYQVSDIANDYTQRNYVAFRIVTIALGFAIVVPYAFAIASDRATLVAILLYLLFSMDQSFVDVLFGIEQREDRMDYIGISQFTRGILAVAAFSLCLYLTQAISLAIIAMAVTGFLMTLLYDIPHARRFCPETPSINRVQARTLLVKCLPIVLATLFGSMIVSVARQYYGDTFGMDNLGIYAAVATPAILVQAAARLLYAPALVPLAREWAQSPAEGFPRFLKRTFLTLLSVALGALALLSLVGSPALVLIYGESIAGYTYLFPWVLLTTVLTAILWFLTDVLTIFRNMHGLLIANACALACTLALMIPLENAFDMNGLNAVIIASLAVGIVVALLFVLRTMDSKRKVLEGDA